MNTELRSKLGSICRRVNNKVKNNYLKISNVRGKNFCVCCQSRVISSDWIHTKNQSCPICGSKRRHRLLEIYLTKYTNMLKSDKKLLLHIAPEKNITRLFSKYKAPQFITADLNEDDVMIRMNVTDIPFPDVFFDFVMCIHVFEHVKDDLKAMKECCRVLKPDGLAILLVPVYPEKTFEDTSITDPMERLRLFGDKGHYRKYGYDYKQRLEDSGFIVRDTAVKELFNMDQIIRYGLNADDTIYTCFKTRKAYENMNIGLGHS